MKTEIKVLKAMLQDREPKTIREIAGAIKADYRITYTAVQILMQKQSITSKTVGKSTLCQLNDRHYGLELHRAETERKEQLLKDKDLKILFQDIMAKTKTSMFILLVFGSHAKGKATRQSDADIMTISNEKGFEETIDRILGLLPLKTHNLTFTEEEFKRMKDSKEPNVVKETMQNNVILYGIENYYKLKND